MWHPHLAFVPVRLGTPGRAGALLGAAQPRAEHTLLASMTVEGMGPCLAVVVSTTREVFDTYVERVLAPGLRPGSVVVMDDLTAHTAETVTELIEGRGLRAFLYPCRLIRRISTYPKEPLLKMSRRCCDERTGTRNPRGFGRSARRGPRRGDSPKRPELLREYCGHRLAGQSL
jgi:hypothetical protein